MQKFIYIFIAAILGVYIGSMVHTTSVTAVQAPLKVPETVEEWIEYYADQYQTDAKALKKVAWCESGYRVAVYGDGGRAYSVFQFHKPTFQRWAKEMGESLDYNNFQHHIKLASWAFSKGDRYIDDWTCAYKVGLL